MCPTLHPLHYTYQPTMLYVSHHPPTTYKNFTSLFSPCNTEYTMLHQTQLPVLPYNQATSPPIQARLSTKVEALKKIASYLVQFIARFSYLPARIRCYVISQVLQSTIHSSALSPSSTASLAPEPWLVASHAHVLMPNDQIRPVFVVTFLWAIRLQNSRAATLRHILIKFIGHGKSRGALRQCLGTWP